jgi:5-methylcytosine-specific restriction endonuclease McrA
MNREPVIPTPRRAMTPKRRLEAFVECSGRCAWCGEKITGAYEVDHRVTLFNGGADELHNLECLHPACHAEKTNGHDKPSAAKVRRLEARENGTRRPRKPIPNGKKWPPPGSQKLQSRPFPSRPRTQGAQRP